MRTCIDCGKPTGSVSNGRKRCLDCIVIKRRETQKANKKKYQYHKQPKYRYEVYKRGAKSRGYAFDITLEQFHELWQKPCKYCGSEIEHIGLDRIDNSKGYTLDNINTCCNTCNFMKGKLSEEVFLNKCKQIAGVLPVEQVD